MLSDRRRVGQQRLRKGIKYLTPRAGEEIVGAGVPSAGLLIDCRGGLLLSFVCMLIVTESPDAGFVDQAFSQSGQFFSGKALRRLWRGRSYWVAAGSLRPGISPRRGRRRSGKCDCLSFLRVFLA